MSLLTGCGDDDEEAASSASDAPSVEAEGADFCEGFLELNEGDPTPADVRKVAESAPDEAKEPMEAIAQGQEDEGEEYFEGEEFGKNFTEVNRVAAEECANSSIDVSATEYEFDGLESPIDAGVVAVNFENNGKEFHEISIARKKDGVEESFDEILELDEEEAEELVEFGGGTFAEPGDDSVGLFDLSKPGEYIALCFVPVGSTPENEDAEGPPHFTQGMKVEFTVE